MNFTKIFLIPLFFIMFTWKFIMIDSIDDGLINWRAGLAVVIGESSVNIINSITEKTNGVRESLKEETHSVDRKGYEGIFSFFLFLKDIAIFLFKLVLIYILIRIGFYHIKVLRKI